MTSELGQRIRDARLGKGMSLRATAAAASISASLLSQVETGKVQPSVSTLWAIVSVLGLSVDEVLDGTPSPAAPAARPRMGDPVQHSDAAPLITMENGVTWQRMAVMDPDGNVDAVLATYEPGGASSVDGAHMRHGGIEYGYILEGELTLKIDFDTYPLRAGDSFCFDSRRPHFYVNGTDQVAKGIWYVVGRGTDPAAREGEGPVRSVVEALEAMSRMPGTTTNAASSPTGAPG